MKKVSLKRVNAAVASVKKEIASDTFNLKKELRTIKAVISFLSTSDSEEAALYREFLNLKKNANKTERNTVVAWCEARYIYVTRKVYVSSGIDGDDVNVEYSGLLPCSKSGKTYVNAIDAIAAIRKEYEATIINRHEIAIEMWNARCAMIAAGKYIGRIDNVLSYSNRAMGKLHTQTVLGDTVIRK